MYVPSWSYALPAMLLCIVVVGVHPLRIEQSQLHLRCIFLGSRLPRHNIHLHPVSGQPCSKNTNRNHRTQGNQKPNNHNPGINALQTTPIPPHIPMHQGFHQRATWPPIRRKPLPHKMFEPGPIRPAVKLFQMKIRDRDLSGVCVRITRIAPLAVEGEPVCWCFWIRGAECPRGGIVGIEICPCDGIPEWPFIRDVDEGVVVDVVAFGGIIRVRTSRAEYDWAISLD